MKKINIYKILLVLLIVLPLFTVVGCGDKPDPQKDPEYNVEYINNNLKAEGFTSYFYQKTIKSGEMLLVEKNINVSKKDDKYLVKTEETKINSLDSSSKYSTEETEELVEIASDPILLTLTEDDFETVTVSSTSLEGKVKEGKNVLGYVVSELNIKISLNSNGVTQIELTYVDQSLTVKVVVKYNY